MSKGKKVPRKTPRRGQLPPHVPVDPSTGATPRERLRIKTREVVIAEISERLGRQVSEAEIAFMVRRVGDREGFWNEHDEITASIWRNLGPAVELIAELQDIARDAKADGVIPHPMWSELALTADTPEVSRFLGLLREQLRLKQKQPRQRSGRFIFADNFLYGPMFFWKEKDPSNRDRALLSILAGNFPELIPVTSTPQQAIAAEAKAIQKVRKRRKMTASEKS